MRPKSTSASALRGQTVIEVLLATVVVAVVLTAIAVGLTISVRNTSEAKLRSYASVQAQRVMEVFRRERVMHGWQTFRNSLSNGQYCFNTLPSSLSGFPNLTGPCTTGVSAQGTEFRSDVFVTVGLSTVTVEVAVSWENNASRNPEIVVSQEFREYSDE